MIISTGSGSAASVELGSGLGLSVVSIGVALGVVVAVGVGWVDEDDGVPPSPRSQATSRTVASSDAAAKRPMDLMDTPRGQLSLEPLPPGRGRRKTGRSASNGTPFDAPERRGSRIPLWAS
jgi:hypothetical protein